jgi:hypothetical protein
VPEVEAVAVAPEAEAVSAALEVVPEAEAVSAALEVVPEAEAVSAALEVVPEAEAVAVAPEAEAIAPEPEPEPEPVAVAPEPEPEPVAVAATAAPAPAAPIVSPWLTVAPDDGSAPSWPATPSWPVPGVGRERPTSIAGRPILPEGDAAAVWAASAREVLAVGAPKASVASAQVLSAPHPCVGCGLPLSANARFCRRCGSRQG